jgi:hypothetical protein
LKARPSQPVHVEKHISPPAPEGLELTSLDDKESDPEVPAAHDQEDDAEPRQTKVLPSLRALPSFASSRRPMSKA